MSNASDGLFAVGSVSQRGASSSKSGGRPPQAPGRIPDLPTAAGGGATASYSDMQGSWVSNASSRASETKRPRRRVVERWICSFARVTAGDSTLTLRRLDERVFRKLATACRSLFVLTRILPSFHMFRRKIPLYMHCYFADPNVVMSPVPEELLTVPSSVGTLTVSLARGRQPRTQPPVVAAGRNLRGSHLMGSGSSSLGGPVDGCRASDGIIVEEGYMLDGVSRIGRSAGEPGTQVFGY